MFHRSRLQIGIHYRRVCKDLGHTHGEEGTIPACGTTYLYVHHIQNYEEVYERVREQVQHSESHERVYSKVFGDSLTPAKRKRRLGKVCGCFCSNHLSNSVVS